jgi:hypothetical protein
VLFYDRDSVDAGRGFWRGTIDGKIFCVLPATYVVSSFALIRGTLVMGKNNVCAWASFIALYGLQPMLELMEKALKGKSLAA